MIVTLTPNPSIDRAITIPALDRGQVIRATSSRIDAGGKGVVNVSRAITAQGGQSVAVFPSGGPEGHHADLLGEAGVPSSTVPVEGSSA
jgi:1-phosphofructokinase/6-phosphofructokinase 2